LLLTEKLPGTRDATGALFEEHDVSKKAAATEVIIIFLVEFTINPI
jgi:hypothetical protein